MRSPQACTRRALGAVAAAALLAATPALAAQKVYVKGHYRPRSMQLAGHGYWRDVSLDGIRWRSWNGPVAVGQATYEFRFCPPVSVQGPCEDSPVYSDTSTVRLSNIKRCHGRAQYTSLTVTTPGREGSLFETLRQTLNAC
jgi:hypothetical protein